MTKILLRSLLGNNGNFSFSYACLSSFVNYCKNDFELQIFEDGTLTENQIAKLEKLSKVSIIKKKLRDSIIINTLEQYPNCIAFRKIHVLSNKILDTMLYDNLDFYFLDSDILFVNNFKFEENYPQNPIFMKDIESSYSISFQNFKNYLPYLFPKINTGFMYFPKNLFDINKLESIIESRFGTSEIRHKWAEQTMWAFLSSSLKPSYFHHDQIVMAHPFTSVNKNTIAIHLVTPYRYQFKKLLNTINKQSDKKSIIIKTYPIKHRLTPRALILSIYYYKLQRKLLRFLKIMPNMEIGRRPI